MRECGILLPVSALPSRYGIGCFDEAAYAFVDRLAEAGQHLWQILPLCPTSFGDSPYQSFSTFAGNPYFISLPALVEKGWLTEAACAAVDWADSDRYVNYGKLYQPRFALLRKAYQASNIAADPEFQAFRAQQSYWLEDYALFMALKDAHGGRNWIEWEEPFRRRDPDALAQARLDYGEDIRYYQFIQFCFFTQWNALHAYALEKGVRIVGDIPIYVALDSADAWSEPELFQMDENGHPVAVAGCPPDAFAADGQLWGNPLYNWEHHAETGFVWWIRRISACFKLCDVLRIDHFRGFDEYFSIPAGDTNARRGHWEKGPGIALFRAIEKALGKREIIAEDLGYVTDTVRQMVNDTGFPGMKVLEFAFDSRDTGAAADYLPHNYPVNSAAYTGTHDNATLLGWQDEILPEELDAVRRYCASEETGKDLCWPMCCAVLRSVARIAVIPMQDYLNYGNEARMNTPGTSGNNWAWRLLEGEFTPELARKLLSAARLYGRA